MSVSYNKHFSVVGRTVTLTRRLQLSSLQNADTLGLAADTKHSAEPDMEPDTPSPIHLIPHDSLYQIFSHLSLRQILICRSVCKLFNQTLTSPSFISLISHRPPLSLLALRPRHVSSLPSLIVFDPDLNEWLRFPLDFLPFRSTAPVASSLGLLYLWADSSDSSGPSKSIVLCNPLTRRFRVLPPLGSAWSRHGTVLVSHVGHVIVLTELAALYFTGSGPWHKFSSNLTTKPRSPVLIADSVFALFDVGSPWRSQWILLSCKLSKFGKPDSWHRLEKHEWGDIFDILKRPRLIRSTGNRILMIGGLKSSYALNAACTTILILRLDLGTLEWEEAGRMPGEMFRCFQESTKFKVFGGGDRVFFSGKRVGRLAMWDCLESGKGGWRWVDGVPTNGDGLCRGFVYDATLNAVP